MLLLPVCTAIANLRYSTDDYYFFSSVAFNTRDLGYNFAGNGRPGQALIADLLHALSVTPPSGPLFTALLLIALVYVGWLLCRLWRVEGPLCCALVVILYGSHPFFGELYTYTMVSLFVALALPLGVVGLVVCPCHLGRAEMPRLVLAIAALVASLSIYQLFFAHVAVALAIQGGLAVVRGSGNAAGMGPWHRLLRSGVGVRLGAMAASLAAYALVNLAYVRLTGYELVLQGQPLGPELVPERIRFLTQVLSVYLFQPNALFSGPLTLVVLAVMAGLAVAGACWRLFRVEDPRAAVFGSLLLTGALATALCLVPGLSMAGMSYEPSPRILSAAAVLVAGVLAIGLAAPAKPLRRALCALAGVLAFSFLGIQNRVFIDQQRLNGQDQLMASRILARLADFEEFQPSSPVAVVGGRWDFRALGVKTAVGNLNITAHAYPWSKLYILREVSGYPLRHPSPEEWEIANTLAATMPEWPRPGSVRFEGGLAVVKLPSPP